MNRSLDARTVQALLDELERRLRERGVRGSIRVAGGAAMLLRFPDDADVRVTGDIDALIEPADEVLEVVGEMAAELGLLPSWLNSAGSRWFRVDLVPSDEHVRVAVASERELVAMKLAAGRDKDFADLVILARHLEIADPEELVRIAYDVYGNDAVELPDGHDSYLWYAASVIAEMNRTR